MSVVFAIVQLKTAKLRSISKSGSSSFGLTHFGVVLRGRQVLPLAEPEFLRGFVYE